jgi:hypothetical protein
MADASKLKRFGTRPPSIDEAREDLIPEPQAVEHEREVPPQPRVTSTAPSPNSSKSPRQSDPQPENVEIDDYDRVDGRSLRKTGRTIPFSTRLNMDTDRLIRRLAGKHKMLIAEVVERGARLLEKELENQ